MSTLEIIILVVIGILVLIYAIRTIYKAKHPEKFKKKKKEDEEE